MPRILVVDDLAYNLEFLEQELQLLDYEVVTAGDGVEALEQIAQTSPDLVLLDLSMPRMDGLEVLKNLRADKEYEGLPVILLTARAELDERVRGLNAGADDYITKPFRLEEVAARIKAQLRIQHLQHEVLEREKLLARVEGVGQTLVTLSHHINNATQAMYGMAQLCEYDPQNLDQHHQLVEITIHQTARISAVLQSLQQMVDRMEMRTADYAGAPERMFDIEEDLKKRLDNLERGDT